MQLMPYWLSPSTPCLPKRPALRAADKHTRNTAEASYMATSGFTSINEHYTVRTGTMVR